MTERRQKFTVTFAGAAVFAALAAVLTLARAAVPYPLIPYLQIDFAEIPIMISFFLFGPLAAFIAEVVHWLFLNVTGADAPLGPAIKIAAVLSTLFGFWVGSVAYSHLGRATRSNLALSLSLMFGFGILLRVAAMTVVNYVVLLYVGPVFFGANYLAYAKVVLQQTTGWQFTGDADLLFWVLVFTAVYNVINLVVAAIPAGLIVSPLTNTFRQITSVETWLTRNVRAKSSSLTKL